MAPSGPSARAPGQVRPRDRERRRGFQWPLLGLAHAHPAAGSLYTRALGMVSMAPSGPSARALANFSSPHSFNFGFQWPLLGLAHAHPGEGGDHERGRGFQWPLLGLAHAHSTRRRQRRSCCGIVSMAPSGPSARALLRHRLNADVQGGVSMAPSGPSARAPDKAFPVCIGIDSSFNGPFWA